MSVSIQWRSRLSDRMRYSQSVSHRGNGWSEYCEVNDEAAAEVVLQRLRTEHAGIDWKQEPRE